MQGSNTGSSASGILKGPMVGSRKRYKKRQRPTIVILWYGEEAGEIWIMFMGVRTENRVEAGGEHELGYRELRRKECRMCEDVCSEGKKWKR